MLNPGCSLQNIIIWPNSGAKLKIKYHGTHKNNTSLQFITENIINQPLEVNLKKDEVVVYNTSNEPISVRKNEVVFVAVDKNEAIVTKYDGNHYERNNVQEAVDNGGKKETAFVSSIKAQATDDKLQQMLRESIPISDVPFEEKIKVDNYVLPNEEDAWNSFVKLTTRKDSKVPIQTESLEDEPVQVTPQTEASVYANLFNFLDLGTYYWNESEEVKKRLKLFFWKFRKHFSTARWDLGKIDENVYLHSVKPLPNMPRSISMAPFKCSPQERQVLRNYLERLELSLIHI